MKLICQKDEVCASCGCELPKGSWAYIDLQDDFICEECEDIYRD